ncbi:MAG: helix-turn-helix domain-containing protein [Gemmatimonas sp.]
MTPPKKKTPTAPTKAASKIGRRLPRVAPGSKSPHREFGQRLELAIRTSGFSYTSFAKRLGSPWTPTRVSDYTGGKIAPGLKALNALGTALGVSLDWLVCGTGPQYSNETRVQNDLNADIEALLLRRLKLLCSEDASQLVQAGGLKINAAHLLDELAEWCRRDTEALLTSARREYEWTRTGFDAFRLLRDRAYSRHGGSTGSPESLEQDFERRSTEHDHELIRIFRGVRADGSPTALTLTTHAMQAIGGPYYDMFIMPDEMGTENSAQIQQVASGVLPAESQNTKAPNQVRG